MSDLCQWGNLKAYSGKQIPTEHKRLWSDGKQNARFYATPRSVAATLSSPLCGVDKIQNWRWHKKYALLVQAISDGEKCKWERATSSRLGIGLAVLCLVFESLLVVWSDTREFKTTEDVKSSRRSLTKGVEYSDLTGNKWYVGKVACHIERTHGITKHKQTIL